MQLIVLRTMIIFFLCVLTVPFFMDTFYYSRFEMLGECFEVLAKSLYKQGLHKLSEEQIAVQIKRFVNVSVDFADSPLIDLRSTYYNYTIDTLDTYRESDQYKFSTSALSYYANVTNFNMTATFSGRKHNTMQSILGFSAYIWYYILVTMIMLWIKRHIELQVVIPFNSLLEKIWSLIIDPMVVVSTN